MANSGTPRRSGIEAWIVGRHELPDGMPPRSVLGRYDVGDVIVRTGTRWSVMSREDFDRDFEWVES